MGYPVRFAPVVMEDYVWVGMEVTIMPGAHIEKNCIINPGIVIQGRVKSNSIVQLDPKQYETHDLSRLQKIFKKDAAVLHNQIISSFLNSQSESYQHDTGASSYLVPGRYTFVSLPEKNCIELHIAGEKISYDLEQFYTDSSRRPVHKEFLSFIRLHHGITLRTRYR
jgi:carbonic anhydrase/acetyltransferase-like protein (isoleucine patch superfamily)